MKIDTIIVSVEPTDFTKNQVSFKDFNLTKTHLMLLYYDVSNLIFRLPTEMSEEVIMMDKDISEVLKYYNYTIENIEDCKVLLRYFEPLFSTLLQPNTLRQCRIRPYTVEKVVQMYDLL